MQIWKVQQLMSQQIKPTLTYTMIPTQQLEQLKMTQTNSKDTQWQSNTTRFWYQSQKSDISNTLHSRTTTTSTTLHYTKGNLNRTAILCQWTMGSNKTQNRHAINGIKEVHNTKKQSSNHCQQCFNGPHTQQCVCLDDSNAPHNAMDRWRNCSVWTTRYILKQSRRIWTPCSHTLSPSIHQELKHSDTTANHHPKTMLWQHGDYTLLNIMPIDIATQPFTTIMDNYDQGNTANHN